MGPRGALFDLDGVLVNTEVLKRNAHIETALHFGGALQEEFYGKVMGRSRDTVAAEVIRQAEIDVDADVYNLRFEKTYESYLARQLCVNEGVPEVLEGLRTQGYRCAVVTSSSHALADRILGGVGIAAHFQMVVAAEEAAHPKPAPDAYLVAMRGISVAASHCVAFEDSECGLSAAIAAGVRVIAIAHPLNWTQDLAASSARIEGFQASARILQLVESLTVGSEPVAFSEGK